jgi:hypothetical protein
MASMTDVAGFITAEMLKNARSEVAKSIARYTDEGAFAPIDYYKGMQLWKAWVGNRKPWDHKADIKKNFGEWAHDGESARFYNFDIWSNLHYGYVGRAAAFATWVLKSGAGYAQYKAGTSPDGYWKRRAGTVGDADCFAALDDPKDQAAIEIGAALWDELKLGVLLTSVLIACRKRAAELNTRT